MEAVVSEDTTAHGGVVVGSRLSARSGPEEAGQGDPSLRALQIKVRRTLLGVRILLNLSGEVPPLKVSNKQQKLLP